MPLDPSFLQRAKHNERFLETFNLESTQYLDWAVTVAFYVAVRYIDAYFYPDRPVTHEERNQWITGDSRTRPIYADYRELSDRSRDARYQLHSFTPNAVRVLIENRLNRVRTHMLRQ